jgi:hypothetical protein
MSTCQLELNKHQPNKDNLEKFVHEHARIVFTIRTALLKRNLNIQCLLASMKTLFNSKHCFESRFRISVPAFGTIFNSQRRLSECSNQLFEASFRKDLNLNYSVVS